MSSRAGHGATTVAATMRLAALAGIRVFVTGGLESPPRRRGQHGRQRGPDRTRHDECRRDQRRREIHPRHRAHSEALETLGVPVVGYGTEEFRPSSPARPDTASRCASTPRKNSLTSCGPNGPRPGRGSVHRESRSGAGRNPHRRDGWRHRPSTRRLRAQGITGKDITQPHQLGRIVEITGGASLRTNIALVRNNARLGAALAVAYAALAEPDRVE